MSCLHLASGRSEPVSLLQPAPGERHSEGSGREREKSLERRGGGAREVEREERGESRERVDLAGELGARVQVEVRQHGHFGEHADIACARARCMYSARVS